LIDAAHANPGEILDTLMVLPFLSDDAVIVYHDVNLHTGSGVYKMCNNESGYTNNLLMSALYGTKILQGNFSKEGCFSKAADVFPCFPNIGAVKITTETKTVIT
jgi:hypothetical protein